MRTHQGFGRLSRSERTSKGRALVIDDDPSTGRAVVDALGDSWEVEVVSAASYALERLMAGERFDAIFCELHLRHLTGREFVRRALLIDRSLDRHIVFMATGSGLADAPDVGDHPCLRKPLHAEAIRAAVQAREPRVDEKGEGVVSSTNTLSPWGPFYGDAPFLQATINHAERLAELLEVTRPSASDDYGAAWLFGRIEEMEIFVELILQRWLFEDLDEVEATTAITSYLDTLHHGLALYFGELSPRCCSDALLATSIPASSLSETTEIPLFDAIRRPLEGDATVIDVDPAELLLGMTPAPFTPTPRVC